MAESFPDDPYRGEIPSSELQEERLAAIVAGHNQELHDSPIAIKASLTLPEDAFVAVQNGRYTVQVARQTDVKPPIEAAIDGDDPERAPLVLLGLLYRTVDARGAKDADQGNTESYFVPVAQGYGDLFEPASGQGTVDFLETDVNQVASMIGELDNARNTSALPHLDDSRTRIISPPAAG